MMSQRCLIPLPLLPYPTLTLLSLALAKKSQSRDGVILTIAVMMT
jgi:hypothetical protein